MGYNVGTKVESFCDKIYHLLRMAEKNHEHSFTVFCASGLTIESEASQTLSIRTQYFDNICAGPKLTFIFLHYLSSE